MNMTLTAGDRALDLDAIGRGTLSVVLVTDTRVMVADADGWTASFAPVEAARRLRKVVSMSVADLAAESTGVQA